MIVSSELSENKKIKLLLSVCIFLALCAAVVFFGMVLVATEKIHLADAKVRFEIGQVIFHLPFIKKTPEYIAISAWKNFQRSGFKSVNISVLIKDSHSSWNQEVAVDLSSLGETLTPEMLSEIGYTTESLTPIPSYKLIYKSNHPFSSHPEIKNFTLEIWVDQVANHPYQAVASYSREDQAVLILAQPSSEDAQLTIDDLLLLNPPPM